MDPDRAKTESVLRRQLPRELGVSAQWRIYDRELQTPLNVLIDLTSERLGEDALFVWVDGGAPDVFSLTGLPLPVAVWSTRHLEIAAALRTLVVDTSISNLRRELARRTALSVIAEMLLRKGQQEAAARCFLLSICGQDWFVPHSDILLDLEVAEINEAYVVVWCYGLAHEFGHRLTDGGMPSDTTLGALVEDAYRSIPAIGNNETLQDLLIGRFHADGAHSNKPSHLRSEIAADLFAAEMVLHATDQLMNRFQRARRPAMLAIETVVAFLGISFIERCAALTGQLDDPDAWIGMLDSTAGLVVREWFVRHYVTSLLWDELGDLADGTVAALDEVLDDLTEAAQVIDGGLADAMREQLDRSVTDSVLLDAVRADCVDPIHRAMLEVENRGFLTLARSTRTSPAADPAPGRYRSDALLDEILALLS